MLNNLRAETTRLPPSMVRELAYTVKTILDQEGGRYKLRGHKGGKFPLQAEVQRSRKVLGVSSTGKNQLGGVSSSLSVAGVPAGFWRIVESGSGRHLITGRHRKNGRRLTTKGAMSGFLKAAERGTSFAVGSPIRLKPGSKGSGGWAQWADHPGHKPLGAPWKRGMAKSKVVVAQMQRDYISSRLRAAFLR